MRTKHFPKEDNSTKVLKNQVSYKSAKCCPPGLRREDRRRVTAKGSGGECLTAKRTFRNGHVSVRCRQRRSVPFSRIKGGAGSSPARQQKRHAFKLTYVSEITLVISNQCGLFGVLGAPPLGERVESNEVRARERLLPFQASKEVPDWIRHDRGREKEVPPWWPCALSTKSAKCCPPGLRREDRARGISARILRNPFITKILQNYYKTLTSKKTQLASL